MRSDNVSDHDGPAIVFLYDEHLRVVWFSHALPPYDQAEILGKHPWDCLAPEDAKSFKAALLQVLVDDQSQTVDVQVPHVGRWRCWLIPANTPPIRVIKLARRIPPEVLLLTDRERSICVLIAEGLASKAIASRLKITRSTVDNHKWHISQRLGMKPNALEAWCGKQHEWF